MSRSKTDNNILWDILLTIANQNCAFFCKRHTIVYLIPLTHKFFGRHIFIIFPMQRNIMKVRHRNVIKTMAVIIMLWGIRRSASGSSLRMDRIMEKEKKSTKLLIEKQKW